MNAYTQEQHDAARAAHNVEQAIQREEARLTPTSRRALLSAIHESVARDIAIMDKNDRLNREARLGITPVDVDKEYSTTSLPAPLSAEEL